MESSGANTTPDPMRHHKHYVRGDDHSSPYAGGSSFMERVAEGVASGMGTVAFVVIGSYLETTFKHLTHGGKFDPEPWILLNLIFSGVAFYTGALVIIAQKAQTRTDKANEEASARHRDELSNSQTALLQQNTDLTKQIHEIAAQLKTLTEQVHATICTKGGAGA